MEPFIMAVIFGFALRYCFTEYQSCSARNKLDGPSLAEFFEECKQEYVWIESHRELVKVDPVFALELEFDHKNSLDYYL